jgi:putative transposase
MIYVVSAAEVEQRRRVFIRKWRLKCKAAADTLEKVGDQPIHLQLPLSQ